MAEKKVVNAGLLERAAAALGVTQAELAAELGASKRTAVRWNQGETGPRASLLVRLVPRVHAKDAALAAAIAKACGSSIEALGLKSANAAGARPQRTALELANLADSVVCAAAEAMALAPQALRPALRAAARRAAEVGLSLEDLRRAFDPPAPAPAAKRARNAGSST